MGTVLRDLMRSERGHAGPVLATLLALGGMVLLPIGLTGDSDALAATGAVLLGLGVIASSAAPHRWIVKIYRRLDRIAPDDPEARPGGPIRFEF